MATSMILQSLPVAITSLYLEINVLPKYFEHLFETTGAGVLSSFPKAYGGVIFVNVIFSGLYLVVLGMKVGGARKRFTDKVTLPSVPLSDLPLLAIRQSKMVKIMLKSVTLSLIYTLMATQKMPDSLIVYREDTNKLSKPILSSSP
jgi:hypothetical protein